MKQMKQNQTENKEIKITNETEKMLRVFVGTASKMGWGQEAEDVGMGAIELYLARKYQFYAPALVRALVLESARNQGFLGNKEIEINIDTAAEATTVEDDRIREIIKLTDKSMKKAIKAALEGYTFLQVAEMLGISESALSRRLENIGTVFAGQGRKKQQDVVGLPLFN